MSFFSQDFFFRRPFKQLSSKTLFVKYWTFTGRGECIRSHSNKRTADLHIETFIRFSCVRLSRDRYVPSAIHILKGVLGWLTSHLLQVIHFSVGTLTRTTVSLYKQLLRPYEIGHALALRLVRFQTI